MFPSASRDLLGPSYISLSSLVGPPCSKRSTRRSIWSQSTKCAHKKLPRLIFSSWLYCASRASAKDRAVCGAPVDPFPDEHRPPSGSDLDRMDRINPRIVPQLRTAKPPKQQLPSTSAGFDHQSFGRAAQLQISANARTEQLRKPVGRVVGRKLPMPRSTSKGRHRVSEICRRLGDVGTSARSGCRVTRPVVLVCKASP